MGTPRRAALKIWEVEGQNPLRQLAHAVGETGRLSSRPGLKALRWQRVAAANQLRFRIGTRGLAAIAVFAAIYAVLSLVPVSRLVGNLSFLTMAEVFSPLAGMVLGPLEGGLAVLVGTFVGIALGHPMAFDGLDFIPGVVSAITAGFAMRGRVKVAAALALAMYLVYMLDPLSATVVDVGGVPVPFLWMHML